MDLLGSRGSLLSTLFVNPSLSSTCVLVAALLILQCQSVPDQPRTAASFGNPSVNESFDYVIVGGGTAGLTVATRLAENPAVSVAVVEAGGFYEVDNGNRSTVPGYSGIGVGTALNDTPPLVDWGFVTIPQAGADNRLMRYARGKTLGGSSARNIFIYHRPTIGACAKWASEVGDTSYTFERLLPFYKKSVDYTSPSFLYTNSSNEQDASALNSGGGPLQVSFSNYNDPFSSWVQPALQAVGQAAINGFQSGSLMGSAYTPFTINPKTSQRSSSESSFLQSATKNLVIYNNTLAERILFSNNTATSVVVSSKVGESVEYSLSARKEVILSAGAFQSPQLLMVSGIGPQQILQDLNIPVLVDLPGVGQNMWDHPYFATAFRVNVPTTSALLNNATVAAEAVQAYLKENAGPLTVSPTAGMFGWEKLPTNYRARLSPAAREALEANFPNDWPELEFLSASGVLGYNTDYETADPVDGYNYASMATALVAPFSRGNVSINSTTMRDPPLINPNWLTDPTDVEVAIAAFKRQRDVWHQMSNLTIGEERIPGPSIQSDEEILGFLRKGIGPVWHAAATCKMGKPSDGLAVVDSAMRVFGTRNLRVMDASVFPFLPPGHPQSTIYALSEKLASEILGQR